MRLFLISVFILSITGCLHKNTNLESGITLCAPIQAKEDRPLELPTEFFVNPSKELVINHVGIPTPHVKPIRTNNDACQKSDKNAQGSQPIANSYDNYSINVVLDQSRRVLTMINYMAKASGAHSPEFSARTMIAMGGGLFSLLILMPIISFVAARRPVWEYISDFIPSHIIGFFSHVPRRKLTSEGFVGDIALSTQLVFELTFGYLWNTDAKEPINWRNFASIQQQLVDIGVLALINKAAKSPNFGWTGYAVMFFLGPVIAFYLLLWGLAFVRIYQPVFLGGMAFCWALSSILYVNYLVKSINALNPHDERYVNPFLPTRTNELYRELQADIEMYRLVVVGNAVNAAFSILLLSYLTYLSVVA